MDTTTSDGGHDRIAGLDGLRGFAVAMVLGFHLYPRLVPGGWLGVSLFFTLSGYLITTVILRDRDAGTFTFGSFYARRVRRLLPAAVLVLTVFAAVWSLLGWFNKDHRTDVFFSLLQVANWQQIWEGIPYGTALASPVVHYWSLAIEEQAYVVLPLLLVVLGARRMRWVAPGLFIASVGATVAANGNQSMIYFGTHTRAAEIMAGVMVALLFHARPWRPGRRISNVLSMTGIFYLALAALVVHLKDDIVYSGGLIITGVVSAMVIATLPTSALSQVFNLGALTWLGTVSYGVYLVHWPVLMSLKQTSLPQWAVAPLTLVTTIVVAQVMHRRFELPMRFSLPPRRILASGVVAALVVATAFTAAGAAPKSFEDIEDQSAQETLLPVDTKRPRIFFFGDSKTAMFYKSLRNRNSGMSFAERSRDRFALAGSFTRIGCPIGPLGYVMDEDVEKKVGEGCKWALYDTGPESSDIAVIWSGTWDSTDRRIPELFGDRWVTLEDSGYRGWIRQQYLDLFVHLRQRRGIQMIAVINYLGENLRDRHGVYNEFLEELTDQQDVVVLDIVGYLKDKRVYDYFPDGTHVTIGESTVVSDSKDNSGADLYERWLEPVLCAAVKERRPELMGDIECPTVDDSPRVPLR